MRSILSSFLLILVVGNAQSRDEPVRGFVTLDAFEIRVEALCIPGAFQESWQIEPGEITGSSKDRILARALELLRSGTSVRSPDFSFDFDSSHTRFVKLTKDLGYVPDDREAIPLGEAIIGVSMSSRCANVNDLEIGWNWRAPNQTRVPVQLVVDNDIMARYLTSDNPVMIWGRAEDTDYAPSLIAVPHIKMVSRQNRKILLQVGLGLLALAGILVLVLKTKTPSLVFFLIPLGLVALFGAFRFAKSVPDLPEGEPAGDIVYALLNNTYHSFDFRDEEDIYDTLETSISGPLLEAAYLEVRKGLELEIRGGPRVKIKGIDLRQCEVIARNEDSGSFDVQSEWVAVGNVNHWGHTHLRTNRYRAILRIGAIDNSWKIQKMQVLDEERTQQVTTTDRAIQ